MLDSPPIYAMLAFYVPFLLVLLYKRTSFIDHLVYFAFFIYVNYVIAITLFPLPVHKEEIAFGVSSHFAKNVFIPFSDIIRSLKTGNTTTVLRNIGGNIVMFMPLGFFAPMLVKAINSTKRIFLVGLLTSILIEATQFTISAILGFTYKITSTDDVILNTMGALIGLAILRFIAPALKDVLTIDVKPFSGRIGQLLSSTNKPATDQ